MRILIIRHGDPDYEHDTLTETGWREAELLSEKISKMDIADFYVSPLGRAKDTASLTLKKMNRTATEYEWLKEFPPKIMRPDVTDHEMISWDWLPQDWTEDENYFRRDLWNKTDIMKAGGVDVEYNRVIDNFDKLLAGHGYVRDGENYRVERPNRDTIVFFCHFGLECVLLSRLMNVSPMILWHHTCAAPSSVTSIYTE
jgi:probable phosphoglycerate mutase